MKWFDVPYDEKMKAEEMAEAVMEAFLPKSDATNAYDLLEDVIKAIEAEPLRYDQSSWFTSIKSGLEYVRESERELPDCGTMACIAGWVAVMKRQIPPDVMNTARIAANLLGFNWSYPVREYDDDGNLISWRDEDDGEEHSKIQATRDVRELLDDNLHDFCDTQDERDEWEESERTPGTPIYVKLGIRKIRRFMETHEARLKARVLDAN